MPRRCSIKIKKKSPVTFYSPNSVRRCLSRVSTSFFGSRTFCVDFLTSPWIFRVNIPLWNGTVEAEFTCASPYAKAPVWLSLSSPALYCLLGKHSPDARCCCPVFCGCVNTEAQLGQGEVVGLRQYAFLFTTGTPCTSSVCLFFMHF